MIRLAAGVALLLAASVRAAAEAPRQFAGLYRINQMEMAGGLELRADGRFRYAFDYGAVSEEAEGKWAVEGNGVLLTTDPMPPAAECDRGFASACFDRTPLTVEDENLILWRWDAKIRLKPVQPRPR
ncbi:MAG TPA: hypothetical protein VFZ88_00420 [Sphingomicrobium sp.]